MNRHCGWIKTEKEYATSCGRKAKYHRGYMYCPFCGRIINILKVKVIFPNLKKIKGDAE